MAQYEYRLPRLTVPGLIGTPVGAAAAVEQSSVGGVGLRGPGETQLEVDRREISQTDLVSQKGT